MRCGRTGAGRTGAHRASGAAIRRGREALVGAGRGGTARARPPALAARPRCARSLRTAAALAVGEAFRVIRRDSRRDSVLSRLMTVMRAERAGIRRRPRHLVAPARAAGPGGVAAVGGRPVRDHGGTPPGAPEYRASAAPAGWDGPGLGLNS